MAATVAAPPLATTAGAQAGWAGFSANSVDSVVTENGNPGPNEQAAFSAAFTRDIGGAAADLWVDNAATSSEALTDYSAGSFADITRITPAGDVNAAGVTESQAGAFADINGDGLDDFIEASGDDSPSRIFINDGGTLVESGTLGDDATDGRIVLPVDIDGDSDIDIVLGADDGESAVFRNLGDGTFAQATDPAGVLPDVNVRHATLTSTGPASDQIVLLSNNFTVNLASLETGVAGVQEALNLPPVSQGGIDSVQRVRDIAFGELDGNLANGPEYVLARQDRDVAGNQADNALQIGNVNLRGTVPISASAAASNCGTVSLADFDNDGDLDIFAGCSSSTDGDTDNVVLLNDGAGAFTLGAANTMDSTATVSVAGDFNDDGNVDIYVGGGLAGGEDFLLTNGGSSNSFLQVDLVGTGNSNADAIGAQVYVGAADWQVRETGHTVGRGQDSRTLHFGLGTATAVAPLQIVWPDGTVEACEVAGINDRVTVTQGGPECTASTAAALVAAIGAAPDVTPVDEPPVEEPPVEEPPAGPVFCEGLEVTVNLALGQVPTNTHDVILGTEGNDVINGLDGRDTICALGGDDVINGGQGRDTIIAGTGNDVIEAGQGADFVNAGAGDDVVIGGRGNDEILGGAGDDDLRGQDGIDIVNGGNGDDELRGGNKADQLIGGGGDDFLSGQTRADFLDGGAGLDTYVGGGGTDTCVADPNGLVEVTGTCELS